jgi:hypothetical protein
MSICARCGAEFSCGVRDGGAGTCWCMALPPVVALPPSSADAPGCWCPACLAQHIAQSAYTASDTPAAGEGNGRA